MKKQQKRKSTVYIIENIYIYIKKKKMGLDSATSP